MLMVYQSNHQFQRRLIALNKKKKAYNMKI